MRIDATILMLCVLYVLYSTHYDYDYVFTCSRGIGRMGIFYKSDFTQSLEFNWMWNENGNKIIVISFSSQINNIYFD